MTLLSCLLVGLAFLIAVGLLLLAAVLLGWVLPAAIERARRATKDFGIDDSDGGPRD